MIIRRCQVEGADSAARQLFCNLLAAARRVSRESIETSCNAIDRAISQNRGRVLFTERRI